MALKLFYTPGACSMVPHIALEEARADFERVPVDFAKGDQLTPEYLRINPTGRVPALLTDHGVLTDIRAFMGYIGRRFPAIRLAPLQVRFAFADMKYLLIYIATTICFLFRTCTAEIVLWYGSE